MKPPIFSDPELEFLQVAVREYLDKNRGSLELKKWTDISNLQMKLADYFYAKWVATLPWYSRAKIWWQRSKSKEIVK